MDSNGCDSNHLDPDVRLPPRKRLLAGLKKQSFSESTSQCSQVHSPSPSLSPSFSPSIDQSPPSEFDIRLSNLLKSYKNGSNMSPEEIAKAARSAAEVAEKAAEAARAVAEDKAAIAAKAVAAAKTALSLVAYEQTSIRDKHKKRKKNKLKNHAPVEIHYIKYQPTEKCGADEEIARRLHRDINSSPRISKLLPGSNSKNHKRKKLRMYLPNDKSGDSNGDVEGGMHLEGSSEESYSVKVNEKVPESSKGDEVEVDSGEGESSRTKEKTYEGCDDLRINGRKRGRIKQKKLPLSLCSSKDQSNSKEELKLTNSLLTRDRTTNVTPMEVGPTWKCEDFKVPECIKQDKLVQS